MSALLPGVTAATSTPTGAVASEKPMGARAPGAEVSYAGVAESCFNRNNYGIWVEETRGGVTRRLAASNVAARTSANGRAMDLYSGFTRFPAPP